MYFSHSIDPAPATAPCRVAALPNVRRTGSHPVFFIVDDSMVRTLLRAIAVPFIPPRNARALKDNKLASARDYVGIHARDESQVRQLPASATATHMRSMSGYPRATGYIGMHNLEMAERGYPEMVYIMREHLRGHRE